MNSKYTVFLQKNLRKSHPKTSKFKIKLVILSISRFFIENPNFRLDLTYFMMKMIEFQQKF